MVPSFSLLGKHRWYFLSLFWLFFSPQKSFLQTCMLVNVHSSMSKTDCVYVYMRVCMRVCVKERKKAEWKRERVWVETGCIWSTAAVKAMTEGQRTLLEGQRTDIGISPTCFPVCIDLLDPVSRKCVCLKIDRIVVSCYSLYILLERWMKKKKTMASDKRKQTYCFKNSHPSALASLKATRVWGQRSWLFYT